MGYIHASPAGGVREILLPFYKESFTGAATTSTCFFPIAQPLIVHGAILRVETVTQGTSAADNPTVTFGAGQRADSISYLSASSLNIIDAINTASGGENRATMVYVPAVQERRFAAMHDDSNVTIIVSTATSTVVWPSGLWLGASGNGGRFLSGRSAGHYAMPYLTVSLLTRTGAGAAAGAFNQLSISWLVTLVNGWTAVGPAELAAADAEATEYLLGGQRGAPLFGLNQTV